MLLGVLQEIWPEVPDLRPLRVGVALSGLAPEQAHQPDLFDKPSDARLVTAIDELNAKFGKGAITYGAATADQASKIASSCPGCGAGDTWSRANYDITSRAGGCGCHRWSSIGGPFSFASRARP